MPIDKMATTREASALQALHYVAPLLPICYFLVAKVIAACLLHQQRTQSGAATRRYIAISLLGAVAASVSAQGIIYIVQASTKRSFSASQDVVVYITVDLLIYSSLLVGLWENKKPLWYLYTGAWTLGFLAELACTALQALNKRPNKHGKLDFGMQLIRVVLLLVLSILGWIFVLQERNKSAKPDAETEPLLASGANETNGQATKPVYGSTSSTDSDASSTKVASEDDDDIDSDSEEPERDKEVKAQQKKRLEDSGNWLNYLSDFKIFIPMLWPSRNRLVQSCLATVVLVLIAQRFLNVLVPRQLGIITDELADTYGTGLSLIKSLAEIPVQQFSYKSIGSSAFSHVMHLSMDFHNDKNSGELIRAIEQGQHLTGLLEFIFFEVGPMFIDLIIGFVYVYTLFDVYMTMILVIIGIAYIWIGAKTTSWSIKQRRRFNNAWRNESKVQNEAINNWQTVSHFNRSTYECERYSKSLDEFNAAEWTYYIAYYTGSSLQSLVMLVGRLAAFSLAVVRVAQGRARVGNFVTLTMYWRSIEGPLAQVSWSVRRVSQMLTDSERLLQLMLTKPSVISDASAPAIVIEEGEVEFDHVDFAYDPRRQTLKDVSFKVKPGQTVALVGETGGGKSTIIKLLYRYYDVGEGGIRIDGQDIRHVDLDSLRDSFGMVPQDPALFNVSLMENIKYARLDATEEDVVEACKAAAIHDKIETFPDKYKSTVGERGVKLSGGELQRVSIARAILKQPKIVLLDEATSMIDAETEALIQNAFKRLAAGRTTFIIAHRLSTIQHADLILVINDGKIIESGSHEELFRQNGKYVALWSKQISKDVEGVGKALDGKAKEGEALIDTASGADKNEDALKGHDIE
ncbi:hypothetical protein LTR78_000940 [Recurvomyces mirabilis]|uniref:Heavy metal tolerance protein n=1 Tax=Recurvomyces mirabilis TaxID=574656 RepID=A0AAE0WWS9_9PEZI|nr:hypothetical protein LTR78_000940 [Recurvomyces mirabilis]KAK5158912.1 hypothetical protein LTS14_003020 [Recurvomyces mirabilis]